MFNSKAVTVSKGLAIIFIVGAHSAVPLHMFRFLLIFVLPFFFTISGYCFKPKYLADPKTFVLRRVKGLWIPYAKWMILFILLHNLFYQLNIYNEAYGEISPYTLRDTLTACVKAVCFSGGEQLLGPYWFLRELFKASLLGYLCIKYLKKFRISASLILAAIPILAYFEVGKGIHFPGIAISALTCYATFFFLFGHALRQNEERGGIFARFDTLPTIWQLAIVLLLAAAITLPLRLCGLPYMIIETADDIRQAPMFLFGALSGLLMTIWLSRLITTNLSRISLLTYAGTHSLTILTWHMLCLKLVSLLIIATYHLPIARLATFPSITTKHLQAEGVDITYSYWWIAYIIVGAGLPLAGKYLTERIKGAKLSAKTKNKSSKGQNIGQK